MHWRMCPTRRSMREGESGVSLGGGFAALGAFSFFSFLGFEELSAAAVGAFADSAAESGLPLPTASSFCGPASPFVAASASAFSFFLRSFSSFASMGFRMYLTSSTSMFTFLTDPSPPSSSPNTWLFCTKSSHRTMYGYPFSPVRSSGLHPLTRGARL